MDGWKQQTLCLRAQLTCGRTHAPASAELWGYTASTQSPLWCPARSRRGRRQTEGAWPQRGGRLAQQRAGRRAPARCPTVAGRAVSSSPSSGGAGPGRAGHVQCLHEIFARFAFFSFPPFPSPALSPCPVALPQAKRCPDNTEN